MPDSDNLNNGEHQPHGGRDRDTAFDRPQKRSRRRGADNSVEHVDVSATKAHETFRPDRDGTDGTGW